MIFNVKMCFSIPFLICLLTTEHGFSAERVDYVIENGTILDSALQPINIIHTFDSYLLFYTHSRLN